MITRRQRSSQLWMINDRGSNDSFQTVVALHQNLFSKAKPRFLWSMTTFKLCSVLASHLASNLRVQILCADAIFKPWIIAESPQTLICRQLTSQSTIINQTGCRAENRREQQRAGARQPNYAVAWSMVLSSGRWAGQVWIETLAPHWSHQGSQIRRRKLWPKKLGTVITWVNLMITAIMCPHHLIPNKCNETNFYLNVS